MGHRCGATAFFFSSFLLLLCNLQASAGQPVFACDLARAPTLANFSFCDQSLSFPARVSDLVSRLTLSEKVGFLGDVAAGVDRLGIPVYKWWSEALHGVSDVGRETEFSDVVPAATSFPQVILTAASFNLSLFKSIGRVVSTEARAMHNLGLAGLTFWSPNINIFRDPRWGRGQETAGEDPLLSGQYATAYVRGLQDRDDGDADRLKVAACCKHYTAYDLDNWKGTDRYHFNAVVTQQDMDDTFQPPFKSCVIDGGAASVMCSYNQVNGKPTCADPDLLSAVVRDQWKLNGYIVSDCDSVQVMYNSQHYAASPEDAAAKSILAGLDLDCGSSLSQHAQASVLAGMLTESAIDVAISNTFATLMRLGFFDGDPRNHPLYGHLGPKDVCTAASHELARDAARQGIVLLKNIDNSLPLSETTVKKLVVVGPNANVTKTMIGNYAGRPCGYITPLQGLASYVSATVYYPGCADVHCTAASSSSAVEDAKKAAAAADATILVVGADQSVEAEEKDRVDLRLPGEQELLVSEVANASTGPVTLVVMSGGGFDISFAKESDKIKAILWVGYPGEAGGAAMADVIFGRYNPSGRLPMTWYPQEYAEKVEMTKMNMRADASTGYPGRTYRFYKGEVVYAFGDGLSYSGFQHRMVRGPPETVAVASEERCKVAGLGMEVGVRNTGAAAGGHTVLVFTSAPTEATAGSDNPPVKRLVGFEKVWVEAGDEVRVTMKVDVCRDLGVVVGGGGRRVPLGVHVLHIGSLKHELEVVGV